VRVRLDFVACKYPDHAALWSTASKACSTLPVTASRRCQSATYFQGHFCLKPSKVSVSRGPKNEQVIGWLSSLTAECSSVLPSQDLSQRSGCPGWPHTPSSWTLTTATAPGVLHYFLLAAFFSGVVCGLQCFHLGRPWCSALRLWPATPMLDPMLE